MRPDPGSSTFSERVRAAGPTRFTRLGRRLVGFAFLSTAVLLVVTLAGTTPTADSPLLRTAWSLWAFGTIAAVFLALVFAMPGPRSERLHRARIALWLERLDESDGLVATDGVPSVPARDDARPRDAAEVSRARLRSAFAWTLALSCSAFFAWQGLRLALPHMIGFGILPICFVHFAHRPDRGELHRRQRRRRELLDRRLRGRGVRDG